MLIINETVICLISRKQFFKERMKGKKRKVKFHFHDNVINKDNTSEHNYLNKEFYIKTKFLFNNLN